jgi:FAD dependent oxidoreductase TIGR03364
MNGRFDDAVVGAGILGLAHAYHLARRGRRVVVFERSPKAVGASVRNFGMLWPIGQPVGPMHRLALESRQIWLDVLRASGLWHERTGSLHLAYHEDEAQVLREFANLAGDAGFDCALLDREDILERAPAVRVAGLIAGLWSPFEICVDPPEVIAGLPAWLGRQFGVEFRFGQAVTGYDRPHLQTSPGRWSADRLWVCSGDDFQTLYPEAFSAAGLFRCKLQMMRSAAPAGGLRLGPMLAAGLTLRHYRSFEPCPSLSALKRRIAAELPEYERLGIHVMAAQNGRGEVVVGDSHEYGDDAAEPFDKPEIDALILDYLGTFLELDLRIVARWHGTYAKHPTDPFLVAHAAPGVSVVTGVGGAGMTLSFGLAGKIIRESLSEG